jgi:hypothetical protein
MRSGGRLRRGEVAGRGVGWLRTGNEGMRAFVDARGDGVAGCAGSGSAGSDTLAVLCRGDVGAVLDGGDLDPVSSNWLTKTFVLRLRSCILGSCLSGSPSSRGDIWVETFFRSRSLSRTLAIIESILIVLNVSSHQRQAVEVLCP